MRFIKEKRKKEMFYLLTPDEEVPGDRKKS